MSFWISSGAALTASCALAGAAGASISGVCPDGSIFIVQRAEQIPCPYARRVDPNDLPPLRPELLPRPYRWEVFRKQQDPNNPYNLVENPAPRPPEVAAPPPRQPVPRAALPAPRAEPTKALDLALSAEEIRDLALIVEIAQRTTPARLERRGPDGGPGVSLRLARSTAFEARVHAALARHGEIDNGVVLLALAEAESAGAVHGNLTFVQGHVAHYAEPGQPLRFGVIDGKLGDLAPGASVLLYYVLPPAVDLTRPLDIYWDDHRLTATLRP
jgi:hypothetical protein